MRQRCRPHDRRTIIELAHGLALEVTAEGVEDEATLGLLREMGCDDLEAALSIVRLVGGSIVSETRTAPGIGSWAFVSDNDGSELLLWQSSISVPS